MTCELCATLAASRQEAPDLAFVGSATKHLAKPKLSCSERDQHIGGRKWLTKPAENRDGSQNLTPFLRFGVNRHLLWVVGAWEHIYKSYKSVVVHYCIVSGIISCEIVSSIA